MAQDKKQDTDNCVSGDVMGAAVQAREITGVVNLGGNNRFENVAVGDGATINVTSDKDKR